MALELFMALELLTTGMAAPVPRVFSAIVAIVVRAD
jgi:hypothetical protein